MNIKAPGAYGVSGTVLVPPATIQKEMSQASGKAKARYPSTPLGPGQSNGQSGKMKVRALTPGTSPAGS